MVGPALLLLYLEITVFQGSPKCENFFQQTEGLPHTITATTNEQNSVVIILITIILFEENPLTRISPYSSEATESSYRIHKQKRKIQKKKTKQKNRCRRTRRTRSKRTFAPIERKNSLLFPPPATHPFFLSKCGTLCDIERNGNGLFSVMCKAYYSWREGEEEEQQQQQRAEFIILSATEEIRDEKTGAQKRGRTTRLRQK